MKWYPWLRPHFEQLISNYQDKCRYHALLIQAISGMGCDSLIYAIIRFLMCQQPEKRKSCGKCRSCQLILAKTHPDYYILDLEKDKSIFGIGINIIRNVKEKLYERANFGGAKVIWLFSDASLLTEAASNALLKVLEEPPEKTWFFLSCHEPWRLLATLRSRCFLYHLTAPQEELAIAWLQREIAVPKKVALTAIRLCSGAPVAALELLQNDHWVKRVQICSILEDVLKSQDWLSLLTILNHKQSLLRLNWLITILLDALILQQGVTTVTNIDVLSLINKLAKILTGNVLHQIIRDLCKCREKLLNLSDSDRELVLTDQLLTIEYYLCSDTVLPTFYL